MGLLGVLGGIFWGVPGGIFGGSGRCAAEGAWPEAKGAWPEAAVANGSPPRAGGRACALRSPERRRRERERR